MPLDPKPFLLMNPNNSQMGRSFGPCTQNLSKCDPLDRLAATWLWTFRSTRSFLLLSDVRLMRMITYWFCSLRLWKRLICLWNAKPPLYQHIFYYFFLVMFQWILILLSGHKIPHKCCTFWKFLCEANKCSWIIW